MGSSYFFGGSNLEKYGKFWENICFSGLIWPDCGNTTRADLAGLWSIGLSTIWLKLSRYRYSIGMCV